VTKFVLETHPEPEAVQYISSYGFGDIKEMTLLYQQWQALASDPDLDRRFGGQFTLHELGAAVTGSFYGTKAEFDATGIPARFPVSKSNASINYQATDWLADVEHQAEDAALFLSDTPAAFVAKSLAFRQEDMLSNDSIASLFAHIQSADRGTPLWFLIVDVAGGATRDIPINATSYLHRDKIMFAQAYGIGLPVLTQATRDFVAGIMSTIRSSLATGTELTTYAGYVDPDLANAQEQYWGSNLPRLMDIKVKWDPRDVFHNPQSVRPAKK